jgi:hypothetical protein
MQIDADLYHIAALFPLRSHHLEVLNDCRTNRGRITDSLQICLCSPQNLDADAESSLQIAKSTALKPRIGQRSESLGRTLNAPFVNPNLEPE